MMTKNQLNMSNESYLVLNNRINTSYDVYFKNKERNTTSSVLIGEQKSNTFTDTGKVIIGSKFRISQKPVMDNDAVVLQTALLQYERERKYYWSDMAIQIMLGAVCLYGAVSLVIWGAV
jgi:F0F1-type ATP synthase gamma subunit